MIKGLNPKKALDSGCALVAQGWYAQLVIKSLNPETDSGRGEGQKQYSSTVVGQSTHDLKVQGSNSITGNLKENIKRSTKICM